MIAVPPGAVKAHALAQGVRVSPQIHQPPPPPPQPQPPAIGKRGRDVSPQLPAIGKRGRNAEEQVGDLLCLASLLSRIVDSIV